MSVSIIGARCDRLRPTNRSHLCIVPYRFIDQWEIYLNTLDRQSDVVGIKMHKSVLDKLDAEQQAQLKKLKDAALQGNLGLPDVGVRTDFGMPKQ